MRIFKAAAAALVLGLGGCIDVDMDIAVLGADRASVTGYFEMQRTFYDMSGGDPDFCDEEDGGILTLTEETARCDLSTEGSFAEVFPPEDGEDQPQLSDLGDGTVRVSVPLGDLTADAGEMAEDPQMVAMMRPMLEGNTMTFRISGASIVSTNGTVSEDGSSAVYSVPLVSLLDPEFETLETFEAVVRY